MFMSRTESTVDLIFIQPMASISTGFAIGVPESSGELSRNIDKRLLHMVLDDFGHVVYVRISNSRAKGSKKVQLARMDF